jgi:hypothetical protein
MAISRPHIFSRLLASVTIDHQRPNSAGQRPLGLTENQANTIHSRCPLACDQAKHPTALQRHLSAQPSVAHVQVNAPHMHGCLDDTTPSLVSTKDRKTAEQYRETNQAWNHDPKWVKNHKQRKHGLICMFAHWRDRPFVAPHDSLHT